METVTLLLIICAVIASLLIAAFQYLYKSKKEGRIKIWLSFLRFLSVFSILLLLINPSINNKITDIIKPSLSIAVDNSKSIAYNSQVDEVNSMVELFRNDKSLNSKYSLNYYAIGNNLSLFDSLNFNESQSNLSLPFKELGKLNNKAIYEPLVVITDGNQTTGNSLDFLNYENPVFPVIVGDTTKIEDIFIKQINVNNYTAIDNKFPVEIFINYNGNKKVSKRLTIFSNRKRVFSKLLKFNGSDVSKTESVFLEASKKGRQFYSVHIEELNNELNTSNNIKNFSINVIEEKSKILILSSIVHPDLGMLKKSIESNKTRSVSIIKTQDFKGDLLDYQLVILYQPNKSFDYVFKEINKGKLNYFVITGLASDWRFLNSAQINFSKDISNQTEKYRPIINLDYHSFLTNDIGFSEFAPLESFFGETSFKIKNEVMLYQKIGLIDTEKPLLSTFEIENQRCAILLGENIWKWRMNSYASNKNFQEFDGFIANLTQYLVSNNNKNRLSVFTKPLYYTNEIIKFNASYLDKNLKFDNRAVLWLTVTNDKKSFIQKIPFALNGESFIAELSNISEGEYTFRVNVDNQDSFYVGKFKILPFEIEQLSTNSNDSELNKMAIKTSGKLYYSSVEELIEDLKNDKRFKSIQKETLLKTPLIDWKWILGFIIFMLSIEWFTRKYFGKI